MAAATAKMIVLECVHFKGNYPKYHLKFNAGRALVSPEQLEELKKKKEYGREFAEVGKLRMRRLESVIVTRGATTGSPEGIPTQEVNPTEGADAGKKD